MVIHFKKLIFGFFACVLVFVAGFRPVGLDQDSELYSTELLNSASDVDFLSKEPAFWLFQQINLFVFGGSFTAFFLIFALVGVVSKTIAIYRISPWPLMSLFVYISFFFVLHEMNQIRAGVAIALVFWSIKDILDRNVVGFFLKVSAGILFHYSAIIFLPLYLISCRYSFRHLIFYSILPVLGIILMSLGVVEFGLRGVTEYLPNFLAFKINIYFDLMESGKIERVNPLNYGNLSLLFVLYFSLFFVFFKKTSDSYRGLIVISMKWLSLGFFVLFSFSFLEVFAYRISNYLFFSLVLILPYVFTRFRPITFSMTVFGFYFFYNSYKTISILNLGNL
ncbi:hypothetical protein C9993_03475 [Marinobacter sp. Z-F4-2]|nr:hypothetical protein C9993_03475 [Marinobacter sp. Z-F4-2]